MSKQIECETRGNDDRSIMNLTGDLFENGAWFRTKSKLCARAFCLNSLPTQRAISSVLSIINTDTRVMSIIKIDTLIHVRM